MLDKHINVCLYIYVLSTVKLMKLFSDATRLRILMLIARKELCVCQIMGVLCISQPLISRNLAILSNAGLIAERKEGKLVFYSLNREMPESYARVIDLLKEMTEGDSTFPGDLHALKECEEFQKKTGKCDMKTFREFMARKSVKVCRRKD
jgi:ArsR family transcriptional regulator, arsenate/arsenite/antimonite-responsive transcriptional repressor